MVCHPVAGIVMLFCSAGDTEAGRILADGEDVPVVGLVEAGMRVGGCCARSVVVGATIVGNATNPDGMDSSFMAVASSCASDTVGLARYSDSAAASPGS